MRHRWLLAVLSAIAVLSTSTLLGLLWPDPDLQIASAYPLPEASDVPLESSIEVWFAKQVDRQDVAGGVRIDPQVPADLVWEGDKLLLKPKAPFRPDTVYTVTIERRNSTGKPRPVAVTTFRTGSAPERLPTVPPPGLAAPSTATPAAGRPTVNATATARLAPSQPCRTMPVRGFGRLYAENVTIEQALGCPVETERALPMSDQNFRNGHLLWRADTGLIYLLHTDGRWSSQPNTWQLGAPAVKLEPPPGSYAPERSFGKVWQETPGLREEFGWGTTPERGFTGAVQSYERGVMLWSDERWITVLYTNGTWERHPDTFEDVPPRQMISPPTVSVAPALPTPSLVPSKPSTGLEYPTPTRVAGLPLPPPTSVAALNTAVDCSVVPPRGFGLVYAREDAVRQLLGCPSDRAQDIAAAEEEFQGGTMYWRGDVSRIYVLYASGDWSSFPDKFREGDAASAGEAPPDGLFEPVRGFGRVWRDNPSVRAKLGWATEKERGFRGATEGFARGLMLLGDRKRIHVLYNDGAWQQFPDTFNSPG